MTLLLEWENKYVLAKFTSWTCSQVLREVEGFMIKREQDDEVFLPSCEHFCLCTSLVSARSDEIARPVLQ